MIYTEPTLYAAPAAEPVSLAEAKIHCRVTHEYEDYKIERLITAARQYVEQVTGRALITSTWDLYLDGFCGDLIVLPKGKLQAVSSVRYYGTDGTEATVSASDYYVDTAHDPGSISLAYGKSWPSTTLRPKNGVAIRFVAGYGTAADVPGVIKELILSMVASSYLTRESQIVSEGTVSIVQNPYVMGQLAQFRLW